MQDESKYNYDQCRRKDSEGSFLNLPQGIHRIVLQGLRKITETLLGLLVS